MPMPAETADPVSVIPIQAALLSVSDKAGLPDLARTLHDRGVRLISTGGTARAIREAGLPVDDVSDLTRSPEMLEGRVKTLHPAVHAGILAKRTADHLATLAEHGFSAIDLVVVNLYPFEQTVAKPGVTRDQAVEQIDVGGPTMTRAAAKNHDSVCVLTSPAQYPALTQQLADHDGGTSLAFRRSCAREAFARTAAYDAAITAYLRADEQPHETSAMPALIDLSYTRHATLRYGENSHQPAAAYTRAGEPPAGVIGAEQLAGVELSYNNILDTDAACRLAADLHALDRTRPAAVVVKHTNPCGVAQGPSTVRTIEAALEGDPLAAFGGIMACTATIDASSAACLIERGVFLEVIAAPDFEPEAVEALTKKFKRLRLLRVAPGGAPESLSLRHVAGGLLAQAPDLATPDPASWTHAAGPIPGPETLRSAAALELAVRALSSNAIVVGRAHDDGTVATVGAGCGQVDRVGACTTAVTKAGARARGAIACSDAFFPFPDGPQLLIDAGVTTIVHPGGSKRDDETFALCDAAGVSCLVTGVRRFRH